MFDEIADLLKLQAASIFRVRLLWLNSHGSTCFASARPHGDSADDRNLIERNALPNATLIAKVPLSLLGTVTKTQWMVIATLRRRHGTMPETKAQLRAVVSLRLNATLDNDMPYAVSPNRIEAFHPQGQPCAKAACAWVRVIARPPRRALASMCAPWAELADPLDEEADQ